MQRAQLLPDAVSCLLPLFLSDEEVPSPLRQNRQKDLTNDLISVFPSCPSLMFLHLVPENCFGIDFEASIVELLQARLEQIGNWL
jgi:hypothetical protein